MVSADSPVGHLLSRREALELLGAAGAGFLVGGTSDLPSADRTPDLCIVRPAQTDGPYFVDTRLQRSDIRSDPESGAIRPGTPLALTVIVSRLRGERCEPLPDAYVDLWQCDAQGIYSDVRDRRFDTVGQRFLRGYQVSDESGEARFLTIYPGWYPGRTVHIHFKIHTDPSVNRAFAFSSQLYFDDALTDRVHTAAPYAFRTGARRRNRDDSLFRRGGEQLTLAPVESAEGYQATFAIGLRMD